MKNLIERLKKQFKISEVVFQRDNEIFLTVEKMDAVSMITQLRDLEGFTHLVLLTAVDWLEEGYFQLTYLLNN